MIFRSTLFPPHAGEVMAVENVVAEHQHATGGNCLPGRRARFLQGGSVVCVTFIPLPELRKQVHRRDGWCCQLCGSVANLEVHHHQFRNQSGEDQEENLINALLRLSHLDPRLISNLQPTSSCTEGSQSGLVRSIITSSQRYAGTRWKAATPTKSLRLCHLDRQRGSP